MSLPRIKNAWHIFLMKAILAVLYIFLTLPLQVLATPAGAYRLVKTELMVASVPLLKNLDLKVNDVSNLAVEIVGDEVRISDFKIYSSLSILGSRAPSLEGHFRDGEKHFFQMGTFQRDIKSVRFQIEKLRNTDAIVEIHFWVR